MSRVGKYPVPVPAGVVTIEPAVAGNLGELLARSGHARLRRGQALRLAALDQLACVS